MSMYGAVLSLSFTRVCKARSRITRAMMQRGSELASLLPTDVRHWWPIVEDIFGSPRLAEIMNRMTSFFTQSREYEYISIDATIKCCVSVLGQESWRANVVVRNQAPFDDMSAYRRVLTVRGRTGAVLGMFPVATEKAEEIAMALGSNLPSQGLRQVMSVAADNATGKLYTALRRVMPNLQCLSLDPLHLAMVYEQLDRMQQDTECAHVLRVN